MKIDKKYPSFCCEDIPTNFFKIDAILPLFFNNKNLYELAKHFCNEKSPEVDSYTVETIAGPILSWLSQLYNPTIEMWP